jgi:hypothetical protein
MKRKKTIVRPDGSKEIIEEDDQAPVHHKNMLDAKKQGTPPAKQYLDRMAAKGHGGDTELAHVNRWEEALLKRLGGAGTRNPHTGLKQFFNPQLWDAEAGTDIWGNKPPEGWDGSADWQPPAPTATGGGITDTYNPGVGLGGPTGPSRPPDAWIPEAAPPVAQPTLAELAGPGITPNIPPMIGQGSSILGPSAPQPMQTPVGGGIADTYNPGIGLPGDGPNAPAPKFGPGNPDWIPTPEVNLGAYTPKTGAQLSEQAGPGIQIPPELGKSPVLPDNTIPTQGQLTGVEPYPGGTTPAATAPVTNPAAETDFFNMPLDIMPTTTSASTSSSGLPDQYRNQLLASLMPQLQDSITNMPANYDKYTQEALGSYQQMMNNALKQQIPAALAGLSNRGILNSTEGQGVLGNVYSSAAQDAANKGYTTAMQQALLKANMPTVLSQIAQLGSGTNSNSFSYSADPTKMYSEMAAIIRSMM